MFDKTMPSQPTPPAELPNYLAEGVPKHDDESLRALQAWIDELLEYRQDVTSDEIEAAPDEAIETVEETGGGTVVKKKISCGKDNCKCQSGELHGPYKYVVRRQGDSLEWEYKGPVSELPLRTPVTAGRTLSVGAADLQVAHQPAKERVRWLVRQCLTERFVPGSNCDRRHVRRVGDRCLG